MADTKPEPVTKKRRLRQAPTIREQVIKENQKAEKKSGEPTPAKATAKAFGAGFMAPIKFIWRPLRRVLLFLMPRYFRSSWQELKKVTWPKFRESIRLTGAVIIFSVVFGIIVYALDFGFERVFREILLR